MKIVKVKCSDGHNWQETGKNRFKAPSNVFPGASIVVHIGPYPASYFADGQFIMHGFNFEVGELKYLKDHPNRMPRLVGPLGSTYLDEKIDVDKWRKMLPRIIAEIKLAEKEVSDLARSKGYLEKYEKKEKEEQRERKERERSNEIYVRKAKELKGKRISLFRKIKVNGVDPIIRSHNYDDYGFVWQGQNDEWTIIYGIDGIRHWIWCEKNSRPVKKHDFRTYLTEDAVQDFKRVLPYIKKYGKEVIS